MCKYLIVNMELVNWLFDISLVWLLLFYFFRDCYFMLSSAIIESIDRTNSMAYFFVEQTSPFLCLLCRRFWHSCLRVPARELARFEFVKAVHNFRILDACVTSEFFYFLFLFVSFAFCWVSACKYLLYMKSSRLSDELCYSAARTLCILFCTQSSHKVVNSWLS